MVMNIKWEVERDENILISTVKKMFNNKSDLVRIKVDISSFKIIEANFLDDKRIISCDSIEGMYAYIQGKKRIKTVLKEEMHVENNIVDLFLQAISALVQAETYVYKERGYKNKNEYNLYWDLLEKNNCRYYNDEFYFMRAGEPKWMDYVENRFEDKILFQRKKTYEINKILNEPNYKIVALLEDTYHEIIIGLKCDPNYVVLDGAIEFTRAPGKACFTNSENIEYLIGKSLISLTKSDVIKILGGRLGCYHVVEMIAEIIGVI